MSAFPLKADLWRHIHVAIWLFVYESMPWRSTLASSGTVPGMKIGFLTIAALIS
jgi:hypothetical protein